MYAVIINCPIIFSQLKDTDLNCFNGDDIGDLYNEIYYLTIESNRTQLVETPDKTAALIIGVIELGQFDVMYLSEQSTVDRSKKLSAKLTKKLSTGQGECIMVPPLFSRQDLLKRHIKDKTIDKDDDSTDNTGTVIILGGVFLLGICAVAYLSNRNNKEKK